MLNDLDKQLSSIYAKLRNITLSDHLNTIISFSPK